MNWHSLLVQKVLLPFIVAIGAAVLVTLFEHLYLMPRLKRVGAVPGGQIINWLSQQVRKVLPLLIVAISVVFLVEYCGSVRRQKRLESAPETGFAERPLAQAGPTRQVIHTCPKYRKTGKGKSLAMDIDIPSGEIAFIDAHGFDDMRGGVFVTIVGPYTGRHTIIDGAFCWGILTDADYAPVTQQRKQECVSCREIALGPMTSPTKTPDWNPAVTRSYPGTAEEAVALLGGPPASEWKPCSGEPEGCWTFAVPGGSYHVTVPENCLRPDGSIDGWRYDGGYPGLPDDVEGTTRIWNSLAGATIRCR